MNNVYIFQYSKPINCYKSCQQPKALQVQFESILVTLNVRWGKQRNMSQAKPLNTVNSTVSQELSWALNKLLLLILKSFKSSVHKIANSAMLYLVVRWC
jgi:hypothetical protein